MISASALLSLGKSKRTQLWYVPYPLTGRFLFQLAHGELLVLFFARLLPSGTGDFDAGPSRLREKQTNPIGGAIDVHCGTSITGIIIGYFCFIVNKIMHIKPNGFLLARPWLLFLSYEFIYVKWRYLAIPLLYTYTYVCVCVVSR